MLNGDAFFNHKTLILEEKGGIGGIGGFVAITNAWSNNAKRGLVLGKNSSFDRGSLSSKKEIRFTDKETVLEVGGGMAFRQVEFAKVIFNILDFGTFGNGEAVITEEVVDFFNDLGGGMKLADGSGRLGNGGVDVGRELSLAKLILKLL